MQQTPQSNSNGNAAQFVGTHYESHQKHGKPKRGFMGDVVVVVMLPGIHEIEPQDIYVMQNRSDKEANARASVGFGPGRFGDDIGCWKMPNKH